MGIGALLKTFERKRNCAGVESWARSSISGKKKKASPKREVEQHNEKLNQELKKVRRICWRENEKESERKKPGRPVLWQKEKEGK
jgi:hypothetical protein